MQVKQAAILCGGLGTRLGELTAKCPKPLLPVAGRPFLEILVEEVARQGVEQVILLAAFESEQIRAMAADLPSRLGLDLEVDVRIEPDRAGTAGALWHARKHLDEAFFLLNGDSWFDVLLSDLVACAAASPDAIGVLSLRVLEDTGRFGVVKASNDRITVFAAHPAKPGPGLVNAGVYLFRRSLLNHLPPRGSLEEEVLPGLAGAGKLRGVPKTSYFIDIGVPDDYLRAQAEIPAQRRRPAVFFDRDGVLNLDHGHVGSLDRFAWVEGARDAVRRVNAAGFYAFVVTNQAGIAKGFYGEHDYRAIKAHMRAELSEVGAFLDDERFCPYHPEGTVEMFRKVSDWRKPEAGMLRDLLRRWPVDVGRSFLVGDKESDLLAGRAAGIASYLFAGGNLDAFVAPLMAVRSATGPNKSEREIKAQG